MKRAEAARDGLSHAKGAQRIQQRHRWTGRLEETVAGRWDEESFYCHILVEVWRWEISSPNNRFMCPVELQISRKRNLKHHPCWLVIGARPQSGIWTNALPLIPFSSGWPVATTTCLELFGMQQVKREDLLCQRLQGFAIHIWWNVQLIVGIPLISSMSIAQSAVNVGGHLRSVHRTGIWCLDLFLHTALLLSPFAGLLIFGAFIWGCRLRRGSAACRVCIAASSWWAVSLLLFMSKLTKP